MNKQTSKKYDKITISFTEADEDIINFVRELKRSNKASEFVREAIREKLNKSAENNELALEVRKMEERIKAIEMNLIGNKPVTNLEADKINNNKEEYYQTNQSINSVEKENNASIVTNNNHIETDEKVNKALNFFEL